MVYNYTKEEGELLIKFSQLNDFSMTGSSPP